MIWVTSAASSTTRWARHGRRRHSWTGYATRRTFAGGDSSTSSTARGLRPGAVIDHTRLPGRSTPLIEVADIM
ncbi:hypothetical protein MB27_20750 [Actinoplanes utahensis]|uniref:Uncharacterized protein n=1 Tax=Actinoplanes utahensis TaxID=1869 RepID=A0A0A6UNH8_ACTUT|nr:hypothetical protein MB27_20750 [Actinoplanes utahensis]